MLILSSKLIKLILALLVGYHVKKVIIRWSASSAPLLTHQEQSQTESTIFQSLNRTIEECFSDQAPNRFSYCEANDILTETKEKTYPVALYEEAGPSVCEIPVIGFVIIVFLGAYTVAMVFKFSYDCFVCRSKSTRKVSFSRQSVDDQDQDTYTGCRPSLKRSNSTCCSSATYITAPFGSRSSPDLSFISANSHRSSFVSEAPILGPTYKIGDTINTGVMNMKVLDIIGQGSQATLYKVHNGVSVIAAKLCYADKTSAALRLEYLIMADLNHRNIVSVYEDVPRGYLMECLHDDLFNLIQTYNYLPPRLRDDISLGIIQAVCYLHDRNIAHLDIKPENVLLTSSGIPKLADFGLALPTLNKDGSKYYLNFFRGTFLFTPPEMYVLCSPIDITKSDSWSLGVTLFNMMTGQVPFGGSTRDRHLFNQLRQNYCIPPSLQNPIRANADFLYYMQMVKGLCTVDPDLRSSPSEALSSYWACNNGV